MLKLGSAGDAARKLALATQDTLVQASLLHAAEFSVLCLFFSQKIAFLLMLECHVLTFRLLLLAFWLEPGRLLYSLSASYSTALFSVTLSSQIEWDILVTDATHVNMTALVLYGACTTFDFYAEKRTELL